MLVLVELVCSRLLKGCSVDVSSGIWKMYIESRRYLVIPVELQFQCIHWVGGWDSQVMVQAFIVVGRGFP